MPPSLDHLILFLPSTAHKTPLIPPSFTHNFTLTPGGTHADGLTANTLILLADGCYIELISFITPDTDAISNHWWGPDPTRKGWTDWCLTNSLSAEDNFETLEGNVKNVYAKPLNGGRKRPDGTTVEWSVTFPAGSRGAQDLRGKIPFWCHDITPRSYRVPLSTTATTHPSGVLGVRGLTIIVPTKEDLDRLVETYSKTFKVMPLSGGHAVAVEIGRVVPIKGFEEGPRIMVKVADTEEERKRVERGFWFGDVVLAKVANSEEDVGTRERVDVGKDDVGGIWIEHVAVR